MEGQTQPRGSRSAADLSLIADRLGEAVAICERGEISWSSDRLAELIGSGSARTLVGKNLLEFVEDTGDGLPSRRVPTGVMCRIGAGTDRGSLVRVSVLTMEGETPADLKGLESDREIWLVQDTSLEQEVESLSRALAETGGQLESLRGELNRDRDELIALLSHELRTPLTVISGYSKLLLSERAGELSDDQRRYLEQSSRSCDRLNSFVLDLLEGSSESPDAFVLSIEDSPVSPTIRAVVEFFGPALAERDLRVEVSMDQNLPDCRHDPGRIEQVLTNLLGNAIKYTKAGSTINISVCRDDRSDGACVEIVMIDDGPGIGLEDSERIFEPYVRMAGSESVSGVGLGLAICRRIVEAHGGEIRVTAESGRGSRFAFTIPVSKLQLWEES